MSTIDHHSRRDPGLNAKLKHKVRMTRGSLKKGESTIDHQSRRDPGLNAKLSTRRE